MTHKGTGLVSGKMRVGRRSLVDLDVQIEFANSEPVATSALFTTRSTACPFWTVISAGSKENFFAVTSTRLGAADVANTGLIDRS